MRLLESIGYRRVGHYAGGIRAWRVAGLSFDVGTARSVRPEERSERAVLAPGTPDR